MPNDNEVYFRSLAWPEGTSAYHNIPQYMDDPIAACSQRRCAVQAGGCVGVFPIYLSSRFERVVTFEPDPLNMACLRQNVTQQNVTSIPVALSDAMGLCGVHRVTINPGATQVNGGDAIITEPLDFENLSDVDFIQFDVEGYELKALKGAEKTIRRTWPVIMLELKNLGDRVGDSDHSTRDWLTALGYVERGSRGKDYWFTRNVG